MSIRAIAILYQHRDQAESKAELKFIIIPGQDWLADDNSFSLTEKKLLSHSVCAGLDIKCHCSDSHYACSVCVQSVKRLDEEKDVP